MSPYAGLSAYYRKDAPDSERNARMVAIGILAPSTGRYGRLGRAWNHASQLKILAQYAPSTSFTDTENMQKTQTRQVSWSYISRSITTLIYLLRLTRPRH